MELRHLRYFVAVAEALNFRRAAEQLRVAQPALSKQIKDLEHAVGARLLDRNTSGVMLTDAGVVLLEEVRDILERVEMAAAAAREAAAGRSGRLTVGNLGAISAVFLPATLLAFRAKYPQVEVNLHELSLPDQLAALQAGEVQVCFSVEPPTALPQGLQAVEVLESRVAVAMSPGHRLARSTKVSLTEIAAEPLLYVGEMERHSLHGQKIQSMFAARGIKHRPLRRVNGSESLIAMIAGDQGISLLLPLIRSENHITFRRIKEEGDDLQVRILAVWRQGAHSQLATNFVEVMRTVTKRA